VIDYLKVDFFRVNDSRKLNTGNITIKSESTLSVKSQSKSDVFDFNKIWFNGGFVFKSEDYYENEVFSSVFISYLKTINQNKTIGRALRDTDINKIDMLLLASKIGLKVPDTIITDNKKELQKSKLPTNQKKPLSLN